MRKKRKHRRPKPPHPCGTSKHGKKKVKRDVRIKASEAFRGIRNRHSKSSERRACKAQDERFTDADCPGWYRMKLQRTWTLKTRYGTVTLKTVTGGIDRVIRTKQGRRRHFAAWKEISQELNFPVGISQEELERTLNADLMEQYIEAPFWKMRHLSNWHPIKKDTVRKPLKHNSISHEEYRELPVGRRGC